MSDDGKFKESNKLWLLRQKHHEPKFTPETLIEAANGYFEWCIDNPFNGNYRPFTIGGFCIHAGICLKTFYNYLNHPNLFYVAEQIQLIIKTQQLEGALVGVFKENLAARINQVNETISVQDTTLELSNYSNEELIERVKLVNKLEKN